VDTSFLWVDTSFLWVDTSFPRAGITHTTAHTITHTRAGITHTITHITQRLQQMLGSVAAQLFPKLVTVLALDKDVKPFSSA
jgi:hypothetical protein